MDAKYSELEAEILASLDLRSIAESLGIRLTSSTANQYGFVECYARFRDEKSPSAAFNIKTGRYLDSGGNNEHYSLWELAAQTKAFADWKTARLHYARKAGIRLPGEEGATRRQGDGENGKEISPSPTPLVAPSFFPWNPALALLFAQSKGFDPAKLDRLQSLGLRMASVGGTSCMVFEVRGAGGQSTGWAAIRLDGGWFRPKDGDPYKKKNLPGTKAGVIGSPLPTPHSLLPSRVWQVEGESDLIALLLSLPDGCTDLIYSPSNGAGQAPDPAILSALKDREVWIIPDADTPGVKLADSWGLAIADAGGKARIVDLGFPVTEKHGKDLRDWLKDKENRQGEGMRGRGGENSPFFDSLLPTPYSLLVDLAAKGRRIDPKPGLSNARVEWDEEGKERIKPRRVEEIAKELLAITGGWPKRVGKRLFVISDAADSRTVEPSVLTGKDPGAAKPLAQEVRWLEEDAALFAWIQGRVGVVDWKQKSNLVTKKEFLRHLESSVEGFHAIEAFPHEPRIPGHYYLDFPEVARDGSALSELLDLLNPETDVDRELLLAMFATVFWGGRAGCRPAFLITSDAGRGTGKSIVTEIAGSLAGGLVDFDNGADPENLRRRLLSGESLTKRVVRLDNIKSHNLSSAILESFITSASISGHVLYVGDGSRPNLMTYMLTVNGPALSADMAQRCVTIKLSVPKYDGDWQTKIQSITQDRIHETVGDILDVLRRPATKLRSRFRWPDWVNGVLSKLDFQEEIQEVILSRASDANVDTEEIWLLEEGIRERLQALQYDTDLDWVYIPNYLLVRWFNEIANERKNAMQVGRHVGQFIKEGRCTYLENCRTKTDRGIMWKPKVTSGVILRNLATREKNTKGAY